MTTNLDRYKADLKKLSELGNDLTVDINFQDPSQADLLSEKHKKAAEKYKGFFQGKYQKWYFESYSLVKQLAPDRLKEFEQLYLGEGRRKGINAITYTIQDWLNGVRSSVGYDNEKHFNDVAIVAMRFSTQMSIVEAIHQRFESSLFDIKQLVQADLFDSELDAAKELLRHGFLRAAGAIVGVVIEKHLAQVAVNHGVPIKKQNPTIADLNDALKNGSVLDIPAWRGIQRLGDLRNLCDHNKNREPTAEEVSELISGVDKLIKTLY